MKIQGKAFVVRHQVSQKGTSYYDLLPEGSNKILTVFITKNTPEQFRELPVQANIYYSLSLAEDRQSGFLSEFEEIK